MTIKSELFIQIDFSLNLTKKLLMLNVISTFSSVSEKKHILGVRAASFLYPKNRSGKDLLVCVYVCVHVHVCVYECVCACVSVSECVYECVCDSECMCDCVCVSVSAGSGCEG